MNKKKKGFVIPEEKGVKKEKLNWFLRAITLGDRFSYQDFFDRLKSVSRGYASLDYSLDRYELSDVIKLDILLNGDKVDALAYMAHRSVATSKGQQFTEALKEVIPRQQFDVAIQLSLIHI